MIPLYSRMVLARVQSNTDCFSQRASDACQESSLVQILDSELLPTCSTNRKKKSDCSALFFLVSPSFFSNMTSLPNISRWPVLWFSDEKWEETFNLARRLGVFTYFIILSYMWSQWCYLLPWGSSAGVCDIQTKRIRHTILKTRSGSSLSYIQIKCGNQKVQGDKRKAKMSGPPQFVKYFHNLWKSGFKWIATNQCITNKLQSHRCSAKPVQISRKKSVVHVTINYEQNLPQTFFFTQKR